jgi:phosphoglucosamine mutase
MRIVIDCANGAAYKVAPEVLWELGADIVPLGVTRTAPTSIWIAAPPRRRRCAPRCAKCAPISASRWTATRPGGDGDEQGRVIDGDQILALIAKSWSKNDQLKGRRRGRHGGCRTPGLTIISAG